MPETTILKENRSFRDHANYIYPSSSGERSAEARKGMGDDVTRDLMDRGPSDPFTPSVARSVEPLKEGEKPALKKRGVSRTEIDHFAGAANPFKIERSRSFDLGKPSEKPSVMQPAREFHYQSRPGPFKFTE